jgi:hypothetical protein
MHSPQFHDASEELTQAIREVEAVVETMRAGTTHWRHTSSFHTACRNDAWRNAAELDKLSHAEKEHVYRS